MIRNHLRSNAIGYVAVFIALSGTAIANHPGGEDTISSEDIINGEVRTNDISNSNGVRSADVRDDTLEDGGLAAADLAPDSVGSSEIASASIGTFEIQANQVLGRNIATSTINGGHIATDALSANDLANDSVGRFEIQQDAVGTVELATDSVGGAELTTDAVTSGELGSVHEHEGGIGVIEDQTAHDGVWTLASEVVECDPNEDMLSVTINWTDAGEDVNHGEKMLANVPEIEREGTDSAVVEGAFDGGGGADDEATFVPVATCMAA